MKFALAGQENDQDHRKDSNYNEICKKIAVKDELRDEEQKCLKGGNL